MRVEAYDFILEWSPADGSIMHLIFRSPTAGHGLSLGELMTVKDADDVVIALVCAFDRLEQLVREILVNVGPEEGRVERHGALLFLKEEHYGAKEECDRWTTRRGASRKRRMDGEEECRLRRGASGRRARWTAA
jgi:hypothetical protein